jgi:multidrug efflux system membrane fusion protein
MSRLRLCCLVLFGVLALSSCGQKQEAAAPKGGGGGMPAVPVSVAKATAETVPNELRVVGTVEASAIVQIKSQIGGELVKVAFVEGQNVGKGDLLFQIDPRPYEDALHQAEAAVLRDRAQINQAQAALGRDDAQAKFAAADFQRYADLQKEGLASKSQYDQSRTSADAARESARATQATIDSARAALDADAAAVASAKLNLSYCEIHAPISGRAGNLLVHAGNLVKANDIALVIIHQVEPIFVHFSVPEQHLAAIRRLNAQHPLEVRVFTRDNPDRAVPGRLSVIDNTVDTATGTIHLKATFDNRDASLWPGQFVTSVLTLDTVRNATVIPSEAVQAGQQGQFVYVVKPDNHVEPRMVTLGPAVGKKIMIEKGVEPGDTVVTDGQMMLFPGALIHALENKPPAGQS